MSPVVLYHANCWDGFCAAWLLYNVYPDGVFVPVNYGQEPPEVAFDKDRKLFIVDFSYPYDMMFKLGALHHEGMVVIDHHKSAKEVLFNLNDGLISNNCGSCDVVFDIDKSGGRLTFDYLVSNGLINNSRPWLVDYTEDRDLWLHKLPNSKCVNAALRSYPLDFAVWDNLSLFDASEFVTDGKAIIRMQDQIVDQHVKNASEVTLGGYNVLAVNATVFISEIAGELAKDRPFGACYFYRNDGAKIWSLRSSNSGVDVSVVAESFGGGGHRHAAGFEIFDK